MRCPYCEGVNQEQATFCTSCGRDLRRPLPNSQSQRPSTQTSRQPQPTGAPTGPANQPAYRGPNMPAQPSQPGSPANAPARTAMPTSDQPKPVTGSRASASSEAPGLFPPRTMAQFEALLATGSQAYTVATSFIENGQRKVLYIIYPRCGNWQQAATLLKALRENQEAKYPSTVIRGILSQQQNPYAFTNGQLQFDRDVRLGAQVGKRYVVETGNGYAADAVRFVLNE